MLPKVDLEPYPPGSIVRCRVTRVEPFGVFVRLVDDERIPGFVHRHDWSWSRRVFDLEQAVEPGDEFDARVLRHQQRELRLSRRQAEPDPYPAFRREHRRGDVVIGQVDLFSPNGAGIVLSLGDGIDGFVPRSEIPDEALELDGFGLLKQDRVAARILRFGEKEAVLSIKEHLRRRNLDEAGRDREQQATLRYHPTLGVDLESLYWQYQLREIEAPELDPLVRERIRRVLVVEDSENVSDSLEMVLRHFGFEVDLVSRVEEARRRLGDEPYDLLLLDINLPAVKGIELIRELRSFTAPVCVFVLTGASAGEWRELLEAEADPRISVFQKPTPVARLFQRLRRQVGHDDGATDDRQEGAGLATGLFDDEPAVTELRDRQLASTRQQRLDDLLANLRKETHASRAVLLALRPGPVFERVAGELVELTSEVQQSLEISPIGNVIRERRFLSAPDTSKLESWFRHLLDVESLRSFAGIALEYEDQASYGLFLFGERPHQLQGATESRLRAAARELGHHLAQGRLDDMLSENQGLLLTGFLSDSLLHEIKNELQALEDYATVQLVLGQRHSDDWSRLGRDEALELTKATVGIQEVSKRLEELVVLFRNLAGHTPAERVDLNRTLRRLQKTIQPFADDQGATVTLDLAENLPEILVNPRLVEQPILNLMINGIEQMALEGRSPRRIRVATRFRPEHEFPVVVTVSDTGRGIHFVDREKIFDLFFTTKNKGTGLGLYVSRFFVERFGGRLVLADSLAFVGSELAVEIPASLVPDLAEHVEDADEDREGEGHGDANRHAEDRHGERDESPRP